MKALLTDKFSFGKVVVDPKVNAIYINGIEKRLEPKLITLLCLLAAQEREVISRYDITQVIWPNVVVGEESITHAIFALRNALGDDAKQPQYIETIPKKGYRFLVNLNVVNESPISVGPANTSTLLASKRSLLISLIVLVILVISLLVLWQHYRKPNIEIESILPLNKMEGVERSIALSPDGSKLLFVHEVGERNDLYSRDLKAAKDVLWIRDNFFKMSPVWIDDNSIAYIRQSGDENQLVRNYQGQPPQVIYTSKKRILQLTMANGDAENLFFLEFQNNDLIELKSLNLRNGMQQNWRDLIADLPRKISQLQNSVIPDTLLFVKDENEKPVILSLDLKSKKIVLINDQFSELKKIVPVSEHSLLVVGTLGMSEGIWLLDDKKQPELVLRSSGAEKIIDAQIDVKNNVIFYANFLQNIDVQMLSSRDQHVLPLPELNSSALDMNGTFAGNNKLIYFTSNRTGYFDLWRYDIESKTVKQITTLNTLSITWFSLSHDEQKLAITYRTDDLYLGVIDIATGKLLNHVKTPSHRHPLAWSNNDKIIYVSEHESEISLFTYDSITLQSSLFAEKSGLYVKDLDGKSIAYIDYARHALVESDLATRQEKILHDAISNLTELAPRKIKLNKNNDGFYTSCQIEWVYKTCFYSIGSGNPPVVVNDIPYWRMFDMTDDGETALVADVKPSSGDIMKMQLRH